MKMATNTFGLRATPSISRRLFHDLNSFCIHLFVEIHWKQHGPSTVVGQMYLSVHCAECQQLSRRWPFDIFHSQCPCMLTDNGIRNRRSIVWIFGYDWKRGCFPGIVETPTIRTVDGIMKDERVIHHRKKSTVRCPLQLFSILRIQLKPLAQKSI